MGIFGRNLEYIIPWEKIKKVGEDIILVELNENECLQES
jgi:sporulation protein YlmC with PRC-barrel domain